MDDRWQNVTDPIWHWARERPAAPAFHEGLVTLTYGELAPLVGQAAVHLGRLGVRAGDRVAINLTNSIDHFVLTLGLMRLGAVTLELAYDAAQPPAPELLARFAIRTVFVEPNAPAIAGVACHKVDAGWRGLVAQARGDLRQVSSSQVLSGHAGQRDDICNLALTSGSTGEPKCILNRHRQFFQYAAANAELYAASGAFGSDRPVALLLTASVGFAVFFRLMLSRLMIGGATVILPAFQHPIDLVKAIGAHDDALAAVPAAMCRFFLSCVPAQGLLFPRLRALVATGGFLYAQEKLALLDRVTPHFYESYGASGFGVVSVLSPQEMRGRSASAGRPSSLVDVQAVDEEGRPLPPGAVGRLRCRGTQSQGFADETAPGGGERFRGGWYYPGDYGHLDTAGYIYLTGRATEVIRRGAATLFAPDIEAVIASHSSVVEVAVVGVPRALAGEDVVALVVARAPDQHAALAQHCQSRLPRERWPDRVFYAAALPKTPAGKLDRRQVTELVMEELQRQSGSP